MLIGTKHLMHLLLPSGRSACSLGQQAECSAGKLSVILASHLQCIESVET